MKIKDPEYTIDSRINYFRITMLILILVLVFIRFFDVLVYPSTEIIPSDFFYALAIVQVFFIWFDYAKERHRILWMQKKREALTQMKTKFTMITSHELRTPIALITGYLDLISNRVYGDLTEKQDDAMKKIFKNMDRLSEILDKLKKLYAGTISIAERDFEMIDITDLIKSTTEDIMPFIKTRKQEIKIEVDKDLPVLLLDKKGISEVLLNLLLNSIKFTPDEGKIIVRAKKESSGIRVEVEDNGIGIPEEDINNIFESFYDARDTKYHSSGNIEFKAGGLGVGLTIAKNTVDAHNGKIWAESKEGEFSRLIFTIPSKDVL